ncbi:hypothetical protein HY969_01350 [Candidatus Kaiserbacteria bacterium]|nr:hypothetical protein [Candidatus Kaiserbacteria bacterium]
MDWGTYIFAALISALLVYPGFEIFQRISIRRKEIPERGTSSWQGRQFLFWSDYKTLLIGDLVFLSALNGFVISVLAHSWQDHLFVIGIAGLIGGLVALFWVMQTKKAYANNILRVSRWDWAFTAPQGNLTIGGKYHLLYFWAESVFILCSFYFLALHPVSPIVWWGMAISLAGYIVTVVWDVYAVGMYLRPFSLGRK